MPDIRQCNRTAYFGVVNPEADDFITLAGDTRGLDGLDDTLVKEIEDKLVVKSYKDFEEKFAAVVYSFFDVNSQRPIYTLERPDPQMVPAEYVTEIPLGIKNPTTGMMYTMLDSKAAGGVKNIDFGYENILDQISPKKMVANVKQIRKELQYNYLKYDALPEGDPLKDEVGEKLNNIFSETRDYFNNVTTMLAVAIQDCEARLLMGASDDGEKSEKIAVGVMKFAEDGDLKIIGIPKPDEEALVKLESKASTALAQKLEDDYKDSAGDNADEYVKNLIIRTFSPLATTASGEIDLVKETENHNTYLNMYTDAQSAFLKCAKPATEVMLGVYAFFKQYNVQSKSGMRPELVVMNCDPEQLTKAVNIIRLDTYLNSVNSKTDPDKAIWSGILANLGISTATDGKEVKQVFKTTKQKKRTDICTMETLTLLLNKLAEHQVKLFFSFETGEDTTFDKVSREGIGAFQERCANLMDKEFSAYAVPCLPNITVIPKNKSGVITGKLLTTDGDSVGKSQADEDIRRFWITGVYIPAAFVAAGIFAAWQCPEYLKEKFSKKVDPVLPGVRFDIEAGNNALIATTTLAKEIAGYPQKIKNDINHQGFGFVFGSENLKTPGGRMVSNLIVYKARSLASDGQNFEPIFQTQVAAFFERTLRIMTGDNKMDNIKYFFSANPNSQMSSWKKREEYVNAIVQVGDTVTHEIDNVSNACDIQFIFNGLSKNLRVKLNRSNAEAS
jgi:hypothetical protein